ncbi:MAG: hypothetical protein KAR83_04990 [Thermodesulfovibrionales bacterium]|nr:hypothetical protein [Thermodesulfovibrionales bacterium]
MKRFSFIIITAVFAAGLLLSGCESTKGAGKRVGDDLKKTSERFEKSVSDATKDFRERNQ